MIPMMGLEEFDMERSLPPRDWGGNSERLAPARGFRKKLSMNETSRGRAQRPWAHRIGRLFLGFFGWKTEGQLPEGKKFVIIAAPHTSNWDLPFMLAVSYVFGVRLSFLMKHTMFWGPFGPFFRWLGGIPVDRTARHNLV